MTIRLLAAAAALAGALAVPSAAHAQGETRLISTPAETFAMAPGGVDMRTGRYVYNETDLSIGGESSQGLALTRTLAADVPGHAHPFGNLSHNWNIMVSELRINYDNPQQSGLDYRIFVHFGGRSQTYKTHHYSPGFGQESTGPYAPLTFAGDKASASVVYTYQAADGTVAVFRPLGSVGSGDCSAERRCAFVSQVTEPDGTVYDFHYTPSGSWNGIGGTQRLSMVTSSRGYALVFEGTENRVTKACVHNLALGPAPSNCASAPASATFGYEMIGGWPVPKYRLTGATGPDNATAGFTYNGATMGFVRPGEAAPWLTNTIGQQMDEQGVMQDIVHHQSHADGGSYAYSYQQAPITSYNMNPALVGGGWINALGEGVSMPYAWPLLHTPGNPGSSCYPQICPLDQPDDFLNYVYQQTPGPVEITDPLGRTTILDYCDPIPMAQLPPNEANRCVVIPLVSFTDPEGARTELQYDGHRNINRVTRHPRTGSTLTPLVTQATYDTANPRSASKPLSMTDARGNTTNYTYAPQHGGLLTMTGPAPSPGAPRPQTRHEYGLRQARRWDGAAAGPPVWVRTATSLCRTSAATGNPAAPCAIAGDEVRTAYDYGPDSGPNNLLLRGQAVTATDNGAAATLRTCYAYDAFGRKISETLPGANLATCPAGPPATALPDTGSTRYDADGRVTGTISPDPDGAGSNPFPAVRNSYDPAGRLMKVETGSLSAWQSEGVAPSAWSGFTVYRTAETHYDMMSRKVRAFVREGAAGPVRTLTEYSYDLAGRPTCTAARMNPAVFAFSGTPNACLPNTAGSDGPDRIARTVYDAAGQVLQQRVGVGTAIEAAEATFAYNLNGQRTALIDGNGNRAALRYDGHGRQDRWTFPSATRPSAYNDSTQATALASAGSVNVADYEEYSYDAGGNRTNLRKRDTRNIFFAYDALNRVTAKTYPQGGATPVYYSYDLRNLQLSARFNSASGEGVTSAYDGFGRPASSSTNVGGVTRTLAYQYDRNGNRLTVTHPDGNWFGASYDGGNRPFYVYANGVSGITLTSYYDYGAPYFVARGNPSPSAFAYDGVQRPSVAIHYIEGSNVYWWYGYNSAGQLSSATRDNDAFAWTGHYAVNRAYTTDGLNRYSAAGLATFGYDANGNLTSDGARTYNYDIENRLIASGSLTLAYDPLGRLFQTSGGPSGTTQYLYDGDALVAEYNGAGALLRRYVHDAGADVPLIWYEGAGLADPRWLYPDRQGSIVAVAGYSGAPTAINRYDEYGIPAATNSGRFQYTGQIWLPDLGMYHYKARAYSPTLGRFMQTDPVGYDDQFNLYAYVGNDPVNATDPDGETVFPVEAARAGWNALWNSLSPETKETVADGVQVVGLIADIATLPTGIGSGPESTIAATAISSGIRAGIRREVREAPVRQATTAAARREANVARGIPESRLGPSGRPRQHTITHSSRKEAREAAQRETPPGGRVRNDAHPSNPRQRPHMQAETANGRNVRPVRHHEYSK